jgi:hypothetical protein
MPAEFTKRTILMYGTVLPPQDLGPAIDALTEKGRDYLDTLAGDGTIEPWMIAKAADWERYGESET